jgi:WhiB family redox-sensing transcriptional regulator
MSESLATSTEQLFDFDGALELARKLKSPDAIQLVIDAEIVADASSSASWDLEVLQTFLTANGEMTKARFSEAVAFLDAFATEFVSKVAEEATSVSSLLVDTHIAEQVDDIEEPDIVASSEIVNTMPVETVARVAPVKNWSGSTPTVLPLIDAEELAWQERALCAQTDPEAFFPEKGGSTREAKRVCTVCEVRVECLEYALDLDERFGIWGGLSERERRRLKKQLQLEDTAVESLKTQKMKHPGMPGRQNASLERREELAIIVASLETNSDEFFKCIEEYFSWRPSKLSSAQKLEVFCRRDTGERAISIADDYGITAPEVRILHKVMRDKSTPQFIDFLRNRIVVEQQSA